MTARITITQLEAAINYWRHRIPATGEEARLCAPAAALATPYALMIFEGRKTIELQAMEAAAQTAYQKAASASGNI